MAGRLNLAFLLTLTVAAALLHSSAATTYQVGDSIGWTIPPGTSASYENWADNKNFVVGDILVFNFTSGTHDVAQVTEAAYDACDGTNPISIQTNGPVSITLSAPGDHYYICTFSGHCRAGQKLSIDVTGSSSSPTTPTANGPSSQSPTSAPPPPSSASKLGFAGLSATLVSIVMALMY